MGGGHGNMILSELKLKFVLLPLFFIVLFVLFYKVIFYGENNNFSSFLWSSYPMCKITCRELVFVANEFV